MALSEAIIVEATGRTDIENIKELEIIFTHIPEIACLAKMHSLRSLTLINTGLRSLRGLEPASDTLLRLVITNQTQLTELGDLNLPQLRDCLLHNNGLTSMAGLQNCPQLQRLWLHGNKLTKVSHLDNAAQLRELWLQQNLLTDCWTGLQACSQLEVLAVAGNPIQNLAGLQQLQSLPSLRSLSLKDLHFGQCPVVSTEGYRHFVVAAVPQLTVVDEWEVQPAEREGATKALLSLGAALTQRIQAIHEEYDRADAELDSRLARHSREAAAVVGDVTAQLQALAHTVQEGKAMMRADYQGQINPAQRAQQDYSLALDIFEKQVGRWQHARERQLSTALQEAQQAATVAQQQAPWLCAVRSSLPEATPLLPTAVTYTAALQHLQQPASLELPASGLAMDYSALRRMDSAVGAHSVDWVQASVHHMLAGAAAAAAASPAVPAGKVLYAPLPASTSGAALQGQWTALQEAQAEHTPDGDALQGPSPVLLFAHPSDACAWCCAAGWLQGGVATLAQLQVAMPADASIISSDNGGSALLNTSIARAAFQAAATDFAVVRLEVGGSKPAQGGGSSSTTHWAAMTIPSAESPSEHPHGGGAAYTCAAVLGLFVLKRDVEAAARAKAAVASWQQEGIIPTPTGDNAQGQGATVPPPGVFTAQASQMLDRAGAAYSIAAAGGGGSGALPFTAEEAAAEQKRSFARIMGTRRAIDSVKAAQATLQGHMAEGSK